MMWQHEATSADTGRDRSVGKVCQKIWNAIVHEATVSQDGTGGKAALCKSGNQVGELSDVLKSLYVWEKKGKGFNPYVKMENWVDSLTNSQTLGCGFW